MTEVPNPYATPTISIEGPEKKNMLEPSNSDLENLAFNTDLIQRKSASETAVSVSDIAIILKKSASVGAAVMPMRLSL